MYFFVWGENLNYPEPSALGNRSDQETEKEVNELSEGAATALGMFPKGRWKRDRTQKQSETGVICGREG